jgi:hypothetical protein
MTHEYSNPENTVLGLLSLALTDQGAVFDQAYVVNRLVKVGFKTTCSRIIDSFRDSLDLDITKN